jgi:hypothetical protein
LEVAPSLPADRPAANTDVDLSYMFQPQAKLSDDKSKWVTFQFQRSQHNRHQHVAKVYHLKAENTKGANLVKAYMDSKCKFEVLEDKNFNSSRDTAMSLE